MRETVNGRQKKIGMSGLVHFARDRNVEKALRMCTLATQATKNDSLTLSTFVCNLSRLGFVLLDCAPYSDWCSRAGRGLY